MQDDQKVQIDKIISCLMIVLENDEIIEKCHVLYEVEFKILNSSLQSYVVYRKVMFIILCAF